MVIIWQDILTHRLAYLEDQTEIERQCVRNEKAVQSDKSPLHHPQNVHEEPERGCRGLFCSHVLSLCRSPDKASHEIAHRETVLIANTQHITRPSIERCMAPVYSSQLYLFLDMHVSCAWQSLDVDKLQTVSFGFM